MSEKYEELAGKFMNYAFPVTEDADFERVLLVHITNAFRWLDERRSKDVCEYKWNAIEGRWECTCGYCLPHRVVFGKLCGNCGRPIKEIE